MAESLQRVWVAGHGGMVGAALCRRLASEPDIEVITRTRGQLDLSRQAEVEAFFAEAGISQVYLAAARVGGIQANNRYPAEFLRDNLVIESNVVHAAWQAGVQRLLMLGSSCIYPRDAAQPLVEEALMTGPLELTNEPYAIAKIAGIKLCESYNRQYGTDYRSVMPTNLYGPGDNFDLQTSHVLPALLRKFHEAVLAGRHTVPVWGSGRPRREFLHVDDLADACVHLMDVAPERWAEVTSPRCSHVNIGTGKDLPISELAGLIAALAGFDGEIEYDSAQPDGTLLKRLDVSRLTALGWRPRIGFEDGLRATWEWMLENREQMRS